MSVVITTDPPRTRFSLRGPLGLDGTGGFSLPPRIGATATTEAGTALCLGPDEWLLETTGEGDDIRGAFAAIYSDVPHALTDISDRALSLRVEGAARALLEMGCPRDLTTIPVGEAARTICHGIEVILWHHDDHWRVDAWRSFMPYLAAQLACGARELEMC